ncbi:hypothetical protein GNF78_18250, partial [Clostridium perfringens]
MSRFYAQIDEEGRVIGLSDLGEKVESKNLIPIEEDEYNNPMLLRMRYVDGAFTGTVAHLKADKDSIEANGSDVLTVDLS